MKIINTVFINLRIRAKDFKFLLFLRLCKMFVPVLFNLIFICILKIEKKKASFQIC